MRLLDLTGFYCRTVRGIDDWPGYELQYPALFKHYFRFWARRSYPDVAVPHRTLLARSDLIKRRLPLLLEKFSKCGFDVNECSFVLFVGKGCTNGHAFRDDGNWVIWIPVETYADFRLVDVFVTHEIAHAVHYAGSPKFYFSTKREQRCFSRQLLTEGVATCLTAEVLSCSDDVALWGGFLSERQLRAWRTACDKSWQLLQEIAIRRFQSHSHAELFQANDPEDILRFRAGYLLGLRVIRTLAADRGLSCGELVKMPRTKLERFSLSRIIQGL